MGRGLAACGFLFLLSVCIGCPEVVYEYISLKFRYLSLRLVFMQNDPGSFNPVVPFVFAKCAIVRMFGARCGMS